MTPEQVHDMAIKAGAWVAGDGNLVKHTMDLDVFVEQILKRQKDHINLLEERVGVLRELNTHCFIYENDIKALVREECAHLMDEMAAEDKLTNYYKVAARAIREKWNLDAKK